MTNNIGSNSSTKSLTPEDIKKLKGALKEMDDSMTRGQAEKDLQKSITTKMVEEVGVSKKIFKRMAKTFHKADFDMATEEDRDFASTYETVTGL
jgi:nitrate reductase beta subunit